MYSPSEQLNTSIRYTLLQVFSKFGKVTKLDFLFHKTGLLKGKPRGYAFVEYGNKDVSSFIHLHSIFFFGEGKGGGDIDTDSFRDIIRTLSKL
jgi:RNA recognition motif-containing protein